MVEHVFQEKVLARLERIAVALERLAYPMYVVNTEITYGQPSVPLLPDSPIKLPSITCGHDPAYEYPKQG